MKIETGDAAEILSKLMKSRDAADRRVTQEQSDQAIVGACFLRFEPRDRILIYGEIVEPAYSEDRVLFEQPHMKHVRLARCYSVVEPDGEFGNVHVATMNHFVTREVFEGFRAQGRPNPYIGDA